MANIYLKVGTISGPINASGNTSVPGGQPQGFSLDGVFDSGDATSGLSTSVGLFASGSTDRVTGNSVPQDIQLGIEASTVSPTLFGGAAAGTVYPRAAVIVTADATGGVANEWVKSYWLLRDVLLSSLSTYIEPGYVYHYFSLSYSAMFLAYFATPNGGALGARTQSGWDFSKNLTWNGISDG